MLDGAQRVVDRFDAPHAVPTTLVHDAVCRAAAGDVRVLLAGDGGDEGFGGYPRHRATALLDIYRRVPAGLRDGVLSKLAKSLPDSAEGPPIMRRVRRFISAGGGDFPRTWRRWHASLSDGELCAALQPDARAAAGLDGPDFAARMDELAAVEAENPARARDGLLARACLDDTGRFLPGNVLATADRMSMGRGVEVRVPFADRRVLDFGLRLPASLKADKRVLRELASRWLPADAARRPKQGFVPPLGTWLNGPLKPALHAATDPASLRRRGIIDPSFVATVRAEHEQGRRDRTWTLWALMTLEAFLARRVDTLDVPAPPDDDPLTATVLARDAAP